MRPLTIFTILVVYILLQFAWWSYLLIDLNSEVYELRSANVSLTEQDASAVILQKELFHEKQRQRLWMVIGEGTVFLALLGWFGYQTLRAFRREMELVRQQKNFLLSVTHEFKSPLASIRLYLQTLQRHDLEKDKQKDFIAKAVEDTERLDYLLENTLLANAIDFKGYVFAKEVLNLSDLVRLVVQKFAALPQMRHKPVSDIDDGIFIHGDKQALTLMLNNLLENAAKYSPSGSVIKILLKKNKDDIILSVTDEGTGIAEHEKKKIFGKFYRIGNEETRRSKGTGLGLYIVNFIVSRHRGTIAVKDHTPHGTTFEITLPYGVNNG